MKKNVHHYRHQIILSNRRWRLFHRGYLKNARKSVRKEIRFLTLRTLKIVNSEIRNNIKTRRRAESSACALPCKIQVKKKIMQLSKDWQIKCTKIGNFKISTFPMYFFRSGPWEKENACLKHSKMYEHNPINFTT